MPTVGMHYAERFATLVPSGVHIDFIKFSVFHAQIPQFTSPTEIIKIGALTYMDYVDVVQVTFANDNCSDFECPSVTCINDGSQNFVYIAGMCMCIHKNGMVCTILMENSSINVKFYLWEMITY